MFRDRFRFNRQRLREAREASGLSLEALGETARVDPSSLSKWENGHTEPGLVAAARVAEALSIDLTDLVVRRVREREVATVE